MHEIPLDVCGADSQGAIGYMLAADPPEMVLPAQASTNDATVVTQVLVDRNDPAFKNPTKAHRRLHGRKRSREARQNGWSVVEDAGRGWRRVVASPMPPRSRGAGHRQGADHAGVVVITVGGGGIPVIDPGDGNYQGGRGH